jgi:hypothetical protein
MKTLTRLAFSLVPLVALVASTSARAAQLSTPPIASQSANTFLACSLQNASDQAGTARVQVVRVPSGSVLIDTGDQAVAPGAGLTLGAISMPGDGPPDCTNGDCPCPNATLGENCPYFTGAAYCRFTVQGSKSKFRAAGCVSSPAEAPVSSPSCVDAR